MKKSILSLLIISGLSVNAQYLENGGFENWEMDNGKNEPIDWSSIQTGTPSNLAGLAPKVISESTDAHTGSKSIHMENKSTFGIVANGIVTNGRVFADFDPTKSYIFTDITDSKWNTPISYRPDSLVGWFKYEPSGVDVGSVLAVLHTGEAKRPDPDSTNYVASAVFEMTNTSVSTWTRFSVPFKYLNGDTPEYILLLLTSGDGTNAVAGSVAQFDDLELVYRYPLGITESGIKQNLKAYGGQNSITVDTRNLESKMPLQIKVYDVMGKLFYQGQMTSKSTQTIHQLSSGVYICTVSYESQVITKKVMIY